MRMLLKIISTLFLVIIFTHARGQVCDNKYLAARFTNSSFDSFYHATLTPSGDIISAGNLVDYTGAGHLAKFTGNGSPLWSYAYRVDYFSFYYPTFFSKMHFTDIIPTADGGAIACGYVWRYYDNRISLVETNQAVVVKVDKYGSVVWNRVYIRSPMNGHLGFTRIIPATGGDFIAYMTADIGKKESAADYSYNRVIRFNAAGEIIWSTLLHSGVHHAGGLGLQGKRGLLQLRNGNIAVADIVYKSSGDRVSFQIQPPQLRIAGLDFTSGSVLWYNSQELPVDPAQPFYIPEVNQLTEQPDGRLSVVASLPSSGQLLPVTILASAQGLALSAKSYSNSDGSALKLIDAVHDPGSGTTSLMMDNGSNAVIAKLDAVGNVLTTLGYDNSNRQFLPNCFATKGSGYALFMSNNKSLNWQLLLTDPNGQVPCIDRPVEIMANEFLLPGAKGAATTLGDVNENIDYDDFEYPIRISLNYPQQQEIQCQQSVECCQDVIDTVNITKARICEGSNYILPDNTPVKDSGRYYVSLKTAGGCDSITYYDIIVDKNPQSLSLGRDTCLLSAYEITLSATSGYTSYNWMGSYQDSNQYKVHTPGLYWVRVNNVCGTKTDSIEIFTQCDFPIEMPNAFTPNNDNLNDVFMVPPSNRNRFINLKIFDRWGQILFQSTTHGTGWDGKFRKMPMPSGVYVYFLQMEGLSGQPITHKGTVTLIR